MRKTVFMKCCALTCGLAMLAGAAIGATYIDEFESGAGVGDWTIDSWGTGGSPDGGLSGATLGGEDALRIFAGSPTGGDTDSISIDPNDIGDGGGAPDGDLNTFDFGGSTGEDAATYLTFDFWSNGDFGGGTEHEPSMLQVYFYDGSTYWRYNLHDAFDPYTFVDGWNSFTVAWFGFSGAGWFQDGGSDSFADVLDGVTEMGLIPSYTGESGQEYGIDNWELHNPEPGTYAVLAFALMSLGVTFRGKLRTGLKGLLGK